MIKLVEMQSQLEPDVLLHINDKTRIMICLKMVCGCFSFVDKNNKCKFSDCDNCIFSAVFVVKVLLRYTDWLVGKLVLEYTTYTIIL